ncbi:E3 ubiquitin-protein ligase MYLIP isoform X1 [Vespula maculifrons]|uniref:E3 ubiquitin-protein ligase MYLIP isoform X1 n=1 Tax=Vespula maculifrons TaxID=7453 RepID=A0ABD2BIQ8_VESMC
MANVPRNKEISCNRETLGIVIKPKMACDYLGISKECDYFGLKYQNAKGEELWLNLRNPIERQTGGGVVPVRFALRVKFWVPPHLLLQEATRKNYTYHTDYKCTQVSPMEVIASGDPEVYTKSNFLDDVPFTISENSDLNTNCRPVGLGLPIAQLSTPEASVTTIKHDRSWFRDSPNYFGVYG